MHQFVHVCHALAVRYTLRFLQDVDCWPRWPGRFTGLGRIGLIASFQSSRRGLLRDEEDTDMMDDMWADGGVPLLPLRVKAPSSASSSASIVHGKRSSEHKRYGTSLQPYFPLAAFSLMIPLCFDSPAYGATPAHLSAAPILRLV